MKRKTNCQLAALLIFTAFVSDAESDAETRAGEGAIGI
jgi:hypothetical protein